MKRKIHTILSFCFLLPFFSCQVDERLDDLTSCFQGAFIDKMTGDTVATEHFAAKLKLLDLAYGERAIPLEYEVHPSGTYQNKHIYPSEYKIWADGPFLELDTLFSNLTDMRQPVSLSVVPNMTVTLDKIELKFGIAAEVTYSFDVNDFKSDEQMVGVVYSSTRYPGFKTAMEENHKDALVKKHIVPTKENRGTMTTTLYLNPSSKYYVRALGRTSNAGDYWNYSKQNIIETGVLDLSQLPIEAHLGVSSSSSAVLQWAFPPVVDRIELSYTDKFGHLVKDSFNVEEYSYVANLPDNRISKINVQLFLGDTSTPIRSIQVKTKDKDEKYIPASELPENIPYFNDRAFKMSLSGQWAEIKGPSVDPSWVTSPFRWEFFDWWNTWLAFGAVNMPTCREIESFTDLKLYGNVKTLVDILPFANLKTLSFYAGEAFDPGLTVDTNVNLKVLKKLNKLEKVVLGPGVALGPEHFKAAGLENLIIEKL